MPLFAPRDVTAETRSDPIAAVIWVTIAMALFAGLAVFARVAMNAGPASLRGRVPAQSVCRGHAAAAAGLARRQSLLQSPQIGLYGFRVAHLVPVDAGLVLRHLADSDRGGDGDRLPGAAVRHAGRHLPARREGAHAALGGAPDRFRRCHDHSAARRPPRWDWARSAPCCRPC